MIERLGVWGRSGSGKSSFVKAAIRARKRVVVFDPMGEYGKEGMKTITHVVDGVRVAIDKNWRGFRINYVPRASLETELLDDLCWLLIRAQKYYDEDKPKANGGPILLVVEEMNLSFKNAGGADKNPGFAEICSRGRARGIEVIGVSQRIAEVATRFRGNCSETVAFAQKGPVDVAAAAYEVGCDKNIIQNMKKFSFVRTSDGVISHGKMILKRGKPHSLTHE